jgi:hypothetical protein
MTALASLPLRSLGNGDKNEASPPSLAMEVYDGYLIVVEGSIGDRHGLKFLLDTGSTYTTIDRQLADSLNLTRRPDKVINVDRVLNLDRAMLPDLKYGPEVAINTPILVADLRFLRGNSAKIDAIIGLDLLSRKNFLIDFARKQVIFGSFFGSISALKHAIPLRFAPNSVDVQLDIDGRKVWMIADTGIPGVLLYEDRLMAMNADYRVLSQTAGRSLGGAVESKIAFAPRLRVGGQDLDRRVYLATDAHSKDLHGAAGFLGLAALRAKQVAFDFELGELRWAK